MVRTLEAEIDVDLDGTLHLVLGEVLPPGHHQALVVLRDSSRAPIPDPDSPLPQPVIHGGSWPDGFTVSRSQIYDEDGR